MRFHLPEFLRNPGVPKVPTIVRKFVRWAAFAAVATFAVSTVWVVAASWGRVYDRVDEVGKNSVALVLGTSPTLENGQPNAYFVNRIEAAARLYREKRVDCLLVSGDNATAAYNEIKAMQVALMGEGVPPERIIGDYAGFRTLDSVVRAKEVFGLSRFTVVSQRRHAERAVFLARLAGIDAVAFAADSPPFSSGPLPWIREIPARAVAVYDAAIAEVRPKFLGTPVRIETDASVRPVPDKICYPR